jgi:hypothetical protein
LDGRCDAATRIKRAIALPGLLPLLAAVRVPRPRSGLTGAVAGRKRPASGVA